VTGDETAIRETVLDYFEGWFDGEPARMEQALHADDGNGLENDSAAEMVDATARGVGKRRDPGERGIDIRIVDVHGAIAAVVVHSSVYREYLHLARTPEGWKIVNALWGWT
jgi:hypothetical protein